MHPANCVLQPEPHHSAPAERNGFGVWGRQGNLTSDMHLAAIAMQSGAKLYTLDADFVRFKGLRWVEAALAVLQPINNRRP